MISGKERAGRWITTGGTIPNRGAQLRLPPTSIMLLTDRPGLNKFLTEMNEIYEMHVYTMGTRTYADAICRVIDPTGAIFGGRILSRDESGSELHIRVQGKGSS